MKTTSTYEAAQSEFDAHWFNETGNIVIHQGAEYDETAQTLSKYIEALPLTSAQNNELVRLTHEMVKTASEGAFVDGSFFAAGLAELSELDELAKRVETFGLELRRDDDGCYWLDYIDDLEMRSIGPMDLDEVKDRLDATENGLSFEQVNEYVAEQRWKRLHPELKTEGDN